ncbi:hypothetical protein VTI28DRAFT_9854 [Corynascus sepedonium]
MPHRLPQFEVDKSPQTTATYYSYAIHIFIPKHAAFTLTYPTIVHIVLTSDHSHTQQVVGAARIAGPLQPAVAILS